MARVERRHMGCVRAWRVCELHGLCEGTARVERRRTWARENGAWSGLVERAAWRGRGLPGLQEQRSRLRARAARGAGRVEGWSGLSGAGARERRVERAGWSGLGGAVWVERAGWSGLGECDVCEERLGEKRKELKHRHGRTS